MSRFPTPAHLASWPPFAPAISESAGRKKGNSGTGHGNRYLARFLGEAAVGASRTETFLGDRYRRIARRRGKTRAIVAVGRSILIIVWQLFNDETARFVDLGSGYYEPASTSTARCATTSENCRTWATASPSNPQPEPTASTSATLAAVPDKHVTNQHGHLHRSPSFSD